MPKKRQLGELKGSATIQKKVLWTAAAYAHMDPCPHKMLPYVAGLTLPHRADGGVDANLMESPYLESWQI